MSTHQKSDVDIIRDSGAEALSTIFPTELRRITFKNFAAEIALEIRSKLSIPGDGATVECSALECTPYLLELLHFSEEKAKDVASGYSATRWLWYLRRIPLDIFEGSLSTTAAYDFALADIATGKYGIGVDNARISSGRWMYATDSSVAKRILRLCSAILFMSQVHVLYRYAGKGVHFRFVAGNPFPVPVPTDDQREAIRLYDHRVASRQVPFARTGTAVTFGDNAPNPFVGMFAVHRIKPDWVTIPHHPQLEHGQAQVRANFTLEWTTFDDLARLLTDPRLAHLSWIDEIAVALIELLSVTPFVLNTWKYKLPTMLERGYYIVEEADLEAVLNTAPKDFFDSLAKIVPGRKPIIDGKKIINSLENLEGVLWPLHCGPVIRRSGTMLWIDLQTATARLDEALEFPRTDGEAANARADHFENVVQGIISASSWKPSEQVLAHRRRTLRKEQESITDIDAIGCNGSSLFLVSCKSLIYSAEYDAGSYRAIRSATTIVEQAVARWNEVGAFLKNNPKGDNYDFTGFKEFVGLVCTPHVMYVPLGAATVEILPKLRASVSVDELATWLEPTPTDEVPRV